MSFRNPSVPTSGDATLAGTSYGVTNLAALTRRVQSRLEALNATTRENWRQKEKEAALADILNANPITSRLSRWWKAFARSLNHFD